MKINDKIDEKLDKLNYDNSFRKITKDFLTFLMLLIMMLWLIFK